MRFTIAALYSSYYSLTTKPGPTDTPTPPVQTIRRHFWFGIHIRSIEESRTYACGGVLTGIRPDIRFRWRTGRLGSRYLNDDGEMQTVAIISSGYMNS
jgi:hypothetical protein